LILLFILYPRFAPLRLDDLLRYFFLLFLAFSLWRLRLEKISPPSVPLMVFGLPDSYPLPPVSLFLSACLLCFLSLPTPLRFASSHFFSLVWPSSGRIDLLVWANTFRRLRIPRAPASLFLHPDHPPHLLFSGPCKGTFC